MKNKKAISIISGMFFIVVALAAEVQPGNKYKNLQVLPKNISEAELDKVMDGFKEGLGVKCAYCHSRNIDTKQFDFDKDDKPEKEMTRNMMRMANDINKKYFKESASVEAVTCYTCHHGNPIPAIDTADYRRKEF